MTATLSARMLVVRHAAHTCSCLHVHAMRASVELPTPEQERSSSTRRFQFLGAQEGNDSAGRAPSRGGGASSAAPNWSQLLEAMQLTEDQKQVPQATRQQSLQTPRA